MVSVNACLKVLMVHPSFLAPYATPIGQTTGKGPSLQAPAGLPTTTGAFIQVELSAQAPGNTTWARPIKVHFHRAATGWTLVGLERLPPMERGPATQ